MQKSVKVRGLALLATVALLGGTAWIATATTGAYFSDTQSGAISGTLGSVKVQVNGHSSGVASTVNFAGPMIPGQAQTVAITYKNTGTIPQDVWITFPNATALSSLNNLGGYGEVHVYNGGTAVFESANLDDNLVECGGHFSSASGMCNPLPEKIKVASNVAVNGGGTVYFKFNYSLDLGNGSQGGTFNTYPDTTSGAYDAVNNKHGQLNYSTNAPGTGLPFAIVATQVGIQL